MGNLRSVQKGFEKVEAEAKICSEPEEIAAAEKLVLPGVGAFRDAMIAIKERNLVEPIVEHIQKGKPFLGICLGLQLLFEKSFEDGEYEGLGVVPGNVVRFKNQPDLKIPHMGWNQLTAIRNNPLFECISEGDYFYFVHSYYVAPTDESIIAAKIDHGESVTAVIQRDNLFATQFHPEKSQTHGLKLLSNFASL